MTANKPEDTNFVLGRLEKILKSLAPENIYEASPMDKVIGIVLVKATDGFSAVSIDRDSYASIMVRDHFNAPTINEAISEWIDSEVRRG